MVIVNIPIANTIVSFANCEFYSHINKGRFLIEIYRIPGNFRGMYISWLSNQSGFSQMKFCE